ncbi:hypothetical protein FEM48_Zijuj01G0219000 [Ziziphus jujuba var. spinosa]|uniref:Uncharacterized protein n=1 Tax=Ziziphus jujuba var. spinosa TaxID=714518 RepID=A0A978W3S2_ZIZJJ|nr:hypothetical protein FEM48_Zijuj01G0219000 [Ziziphus jujuba var. spinosa]
MGYLTLKLEGAVGYRPKGCLEEVPKQLTQSNSRRRIQCGNWVRLLHIGSAMKLLGPTGLDVCGLEIGAGFKLKPSTAMALRTAAAAPRGLRRLFSSISSPSFLPPQTPPAAQAREKPEPSTNLFISGTSFFSFLIFILFFSVSSFYPLLFYDLPFYF